MPNKRPRFRKLLSGRESEKFLTDTGGNIPADSGTPEVERRIPDEDVREARKTNPRSRVKYIIAAAASAAFLLLAVIPGTYSYLTASSDTVINTFSSGAISIRLDEALVDVYGSPVGSTRVIENSYRIIPGNTYTKDPTITILKGSEEAYFFIYVDNALPEEYFTLDYSDSWIAVASTGTKTLYIYKSIMSAPDEDITLEPVFTTVTVSADITSEQIEALGEVQLSVQSYAVQAEGVDQETAIGMAAAFFESEFDFSFDDVDTAVDVSGVTSDSGTEDTADTVDADTTGTADGDSADTDTAETGNTDTADTDAAETEDTDTADAGTSDTDSADTVDAGTTDADGTDTADASSDAVTSENTSEASDTYADSADTEDAEAADTSDGDGNEDSSDEQTEGTDGGSSADDDSDTDGGSDSDGSDDDGGSDSDGDSDTDADTEGG